MSFVKVSRAADIVYNYDENGIARVPILEGECKDCALERVAIKPGCSWTPEVYKLEEHNQVFLFMDGEGYVRTPRKVFNIDEVAVFVPEFDKETFTIHCSPKSKTPLMLILRSIHLPGPLMKKLKWRNRLSEIGKKDIQSQRMRKKNENTK